LSDYATSVIIVNPLTSKIKHFSCVQAWKKNVTQNFATVEEYTNQHI